MSIRARLAAWLAGLSPRERALLGLAGALAAGIGVVTVALGVRDDLAALRARVAAHEHELGEVRRLAARLREEPAADQTPDDGALLTRLEIAVDASIGRERLAAMTPGGGTTADGSHETRVALGVRDATLAEVVALLHALEAGTPALPVARFELKKHPDDPTHFDAALEVVRLGAAP